MNSGVTVLVAATGLFLLQEVFESGSHRGSFDGGSFEIESETCVADCLCSRRAEATDTDVVLLESGEVFQEGVDTRRAEEEEHVIVKLLVGTEVVGNGSIHDGLRVVDAVLVEDAGVLLVNVGHNVEETLLLMLDEEGEEAVELAGLAVENLTLAVDNVFLQIERD